MKTYFPLFIIGCLTFGILISFVYNTAAEIDFVDPDDPHIGCGSILMWHENKLVKYTDQDGNIEWSTPHRDVSVALTAYVKGLGFAESKFAPVRIANDYRSVYTDTDKVGTFNENNGNDQTCSASPGTWVSVVRTVSSPEKAGIYSWEAEGTAHAEPWYYKKTAGTNVYISFGTIGLTITGKGSWEAMGERHVVDRAAPLGSEGEWEVEQKFKCASCDVKADTLAALSPDHDKETCGREGCGVEYRACDTAAKALHSLCEGCNTYRCDTSTGNIHEKVTCSSTAHVRGRTMTVDACGKEFWACASDSWKHSSTMGPCGGCYKWYKSCMTGEHEWVYEDCPSGHAHSECDGSDHSLQASCPISEEHGEQCTVTNFYACEDPSHTHQFPGSQTGYGSDTGTGSSSSTGTNTESGSTDLSNTGSGATNATATCRAGHTYYPNQPSSNNLHRTRTCRYPECRQTWERCVSSTPICNKPYRNRNGLNCWAE